MSPRLISFFCAIVLPTFVGEWDAVVGNGTCIITCFCSCAIQASCRRRQCLWRLSEEHGSDVCTGDDRCLWNSVSRWGSVWLSLREAWRLSLRSFAKIHEASCLFIYFNFSSCFMVCLIVSPSVWSLTEAVKRSSPCTHRWQGLSCLWYCCLLLTAVLPHSSPLLCRIEHTCHFSLWYLWWN